MSERLREAFREIARLVRDNKPVDLVDADRTLYWVGEIASKALEEPDQLSSNPLQLPQEKKGRRYRIQAAPGSYYQVIEGPEKIDRCVVRIGDEIELIPIEGE